MLPRQVLLQQLRCEKEFVEKENQQLRQTLQEQAGDLEEPRCSYSFFYLGAPD